MTVIKKGTIICLETGEYSNRYIIGHFRVLRDIPISEWDDLRQAHLTSAREVSATVFVADMTSRGMIEDADEVIEIHADDPPSGSEHPIC